MENISEELKYTPLVNSHSSIALKRITPQGLSTAIPLSIASAVSSPSEFIIPPGTFNPSKSRLNFQLQVVAQGVSTYVWLDGNRLSTISRVVLYDSVTSSIWLDCNDFEKYAALTTPSGTSYEEFKTKATMWQSSSNDETLGITAAESQPCPTEDINKSNSLVATTALGTASAGVGGGSNSYEGRQYTIRNGNTNSALYLDVSLPFSAFKHTALAVNKQLYTNNNLILQVFWNATDNFAWSNQSTANPSTTAISLTGTTGPPPGPPAYINNVNLQLAQEQNLSIISQIKEEVKNTGISIPIGYPTVFKRNYTSATSFSYDIPLSKGFGQRILALISAPFSVGVSTTNGKNTHIRGLLTTYNTFMNNVATKYPNGYDCTLGQDFYFGNREYLRNSSVQTLGEYVYGEWIHVDSYFGEKPLYQLDATQIDGYDTTNQSIWSIQANLSASNSVLWVTAIIGQKMLTIRNDGSTVA